MKKIKPYKESKSGKKIQVTEMFNNISSQYDFLNRLISLGLDLKWKKKVTQILLQNKAQKVLDMATGTGDLAIMHAQKGIPEITGMDISEGMLQMGQKKVNDLQLENQIKLVLGDSEKINFEEAYFDAATVGFGIRNFENLKIGLNELYRVIKPKGVLVILETSVPNKFPFKQGYHLYTNILVPFLGKLFSKDKKAYQYLSHSAQNFPHGEEMNNILREIGFSKVQHHPQSFGVATIYKAFK